MTLLHYCSWLQTGWHNTLDKQNFISPGTFFWIMRKFIITCTTEKTKIENWKIKTSSSLSNFQTKTENNLQWSWFRKSYCNSRDLWIWQVFCRKLFGWKKHYKMQPWNDLSYASIVHSCSKSLAQHIMARANLNKRENVLTNTTAASKHLHT